MVYQVRKAHEREDDSNKSQSISITPQHIKALSEACRILAVGGKPAKQSHVVARALDMYLPTIGVVIENDMTDTDK